MYLHIDARLPGQARYFMTKNREEKLMLVPPEVRECVVFLASKNAKTGRMKVGGTAFCVGVPLPPFTGYAGYLVTAKHCIEAIEKNDKNDGNVYLRIKLSSGTTDFVRTNPKDWHFHPAALSPIAGCERVDVAVYQAPLGPGWDVRFLTTTNNSFVDKALIEKEKIGPGDEVFIAGLFTERFGDSKNIPVIRIGNIAAMDDEPITTKWSDGHPMEAYLIEARSIGGVSGSPVFVNVGLDLATGGISATGVLIPHRKHHRGEGTFYLLGLVHGHWGFPVPDVPDEDVSPDEGEDAKDTKKINAGIAIVVPAGKIYETLQLPELRSARQLMINEEIRKRSESAEPD
jgi:hypothetical protein